MVAWQRCGMKVRVAIAPPFCGALTMVIFGTVFATTLPRFISGPQARRKRSSRIFSASSASSAARLSSPAMPASSARSTTQGMPLSISVTSIPSTRSTARPVGNSAPQVAPAVSRNCSGTGAEAPGTPSIRASPA